MHQLQNKTTTKNNKTKQLLKFDYTTKKKKIEKQ